MHSSSSYDAIVLGLGGMGSAAAFHLARRGLRVLGLEQFTPPHDRGSSHGHTRVIRQAYFEHPAYVPMLQRGYELWRELESNETQPLLLQTGGLMLGAPDSDVVSGSLRSAQLHGLPHEQLDASAIRRRFPQFNIGNHIAGVFETAAGLLWCERCVAAHLHAAARAGAELHFEAPVLAWKPSVAGGCVEITTASTRYHGDRLIISPGPWAPQVLADLGLPLEVTRQVLFWFQPDKGVGPFLADRFPIYISQREPGSEVYGFPAVDGPTGGVKAAFFHKPFVERCTPETVDRTIRDEDEESLRGTLRDLLPNLDGPVVRASTCLYTTTPDHHFVISQHPRYPQVTVACGFSGHGFKFCSVVGEIVADLATRGTSNHDLSLFSPRRFDSPASELR